VVTEPTDLDIAVAHRASMGRLRDARPRRSRERPREGRDAIVRMGRVLHGLEALDRRLQSGARIRCSAPPRSMPR